MTLNNTTKQQFMDRSANYSTHASRRGVNLLGWGERYEGKDGHEIANIKAEIRRINDGFKRKQFDKAQKKLMGERQQELQKRLLDLKNKYKGVRKKQTPLRDLVLEECREFMTDEQWSFVWKKASDRFHARTRELIKRGFIDA